MVNSRILSSGIHHAKRWLKFSYGSDLSLHQFTERISFTRKEQNYFRDFLQKMDDYSERGSKLRHMKKTRQLRSVNVSARRKLIAAGRNIFKILRRVREINVSSFEDLFGEEMALTLTLDDTTRRFPWELAYDGDGFLCTLYDVGRKIENPKFAKRMSGYGPEHRTALVLGLNYKWEKKARQLSAPEREALTVERQLKKKGYTVYLLRGERTTLDETMSILSEGVSIFHFSGHGAYNVHQPEGRKGSLELRDGKLTEERLTKCFRKAKGAPYLSFLNACQSAKEIYTSHFVDAFVEYGAEYIVGTFWPIYDPPSTSFSARFYREVAENVPIAHALNLARWQFFQKEQEVTTWPSFVLYGSPRHLLPRPR